MATRTLPSPRARFAAHGNVRRVFNEYAPEVLVEGPAGTGKSFGILWLIHLIALRYPGARILMVRKTQESMTTSTLVTFQQRILATQPDNFGVRFYGGSKAKPAGFMYGNGSFVATSGMDRPEKVLSSEWDVIYANEATELTLEQWELLLTRLRGVAVPRGRAIADANPQAPSHWLNQRALAGKMLRVPTTHADNPLLWDAERGDWTDRGRSYVLGTLESLTGVRYQRLRLGKWVAAEGQVYDSFLAATHVVARASVADRLRNAWHFGTADWGYTNPGVAQVWAVDWDGRLYLTAEYYRTLQTLDRWWVPRFLGLQDEFRCQFWRGDPAEPQNIATLSAAGLTIDGAINDVLPGIDAVQDRLRPAPDGEPRIYLLSDALRERDEGLVADGKPWSTEQEFGEYLWAKSRDGAQLKDQPVDANNHGLDALRYAVADQDLKLGRYARPTTAGDLLGWDDLPDGGY